MKTALMKCFKCKTINVSYVMKDKLITKNKWRGFCHSCYEDIFKK